MRRYFVLTLLMLIVISVLSCSILAESKGGGTLKVGIGMDIKQLDPAFISDLPSQRVAQQIHDYLVRRDSEGNIKPNLAKDWEVNPDGTRWTFYLKKGIKFTDGSPFNAEVVKWHFNRLRDPQVASNYVEQFSIIEQVEVVDDYTIEFVLQRAYGPFIDTILLSPGGLIPSKKQFEAIGPDRYASDPVGTGPFIFAEWQPDNYVLLKKNENYHRGGVKLDALRFKPIAEAMTRVIELQTGGIDLLQTVPYEEVEKVKADPKINVYTGKSGFYVLYIWLNLTEDSPFKDNLPLRKAVAYSINKQELNETLFGEYGIRCEGYVPVASWAYPVDPQPVSYNIDKAKQLLQDAGYSYRGDQLYKDGKRVKIEYLSTTSERMWSIIAQFVQESMRGIGIETSIKQLDWGSYLDIFTGTKQFAISGMSWVQNTGEPTLFLDVLLRTGGRGNFTGYSNQTVDKLLDQASATSDRSKRKELYQQVFAILEKDIPMIPILSKPMIQGVNKKVKGYNYNPYVSDYTSVWIED